MLKIKQTKHHRRRLWGAARARVPPIIKSGAKPLFLPPNNPEENFLNTLKRETRDKEMKYYQKLIGNSQ